MVEAGRGSSVQVTVAAAQQVARRLPLRRLTLLSDDDGHEHTATQLLSLLSTRMSSTMRCQCRSAAPPLLSCGFDPKRTLLACFTAVGAVQLRAARLDFLMKSPVKTMDSAERES